MKCGLLGRKLGHSYSPAIHALLGDYEYMLFEKEPKELEDFIRHGDWDGLNVTMPYKQEVIPFLSELTDAAKKVGAVNTIFRRDGKVIGHNTDLSGFQQMLRSSGLHPAGKKCLILGSGGASKVVCRVLQDQGANVVVISRSREDNYTNPGRHSDAAIIVNTTPVGMYPDTGVSPLNLDIFPHLEGVLDVIYNPARTKLLMDAEKKGIVAINGLQMLVWQAWSASIVMTSNPIPEEKVAEVYSLLRRQMENIILIGMPGCGKSTIGRMVADELGRTFVDTDAEIEKRAQKSIPRIITEDGERFFRELETQVLSDFGKQSGLVISTGGGCVTQARNYPLLHQNGSIFWLERYLKKLPTAGRPLSVDLEAMYRTRQPMYKTFADAWVDNNDSPEDAANAIIALLHEQGERI
jgi:shikimate dehydrogenase